MDNKWIVTANVTKQISPDDWIVTVVHKLCDESTTIKDIMEWEESLKVTSVNQLFINKGD
jgi:hypothetical protein